MDAPNDYYGNEPPSHSSLGSLGGVEIAVNTGDGSGSGADPDGAHHPHQSMAENADAAFHASGITMSEDILMAGEGPNDAYHQEDVRRPEDPTVAPSLLNGGGGRRNSGSSRSSDARWAKEYANPTDYGDRSIATGAFRLGGAAGYGGQDDFGGRYDDEEQSYDIGFNGENLPSDRSFTCEQPYSQKSGGPPSAMQNSGNMDSAYMNSAYMDFDESYRSHESGGEGSGYGPGRNQPYGAGGLYTHDEGDEEYSQERSYSGPQYYDSRAGAIHEDEKDLYYAPEDMYDADLYSQSQGYGGPGGDFTIYAQETKDDTAAYEEEVYDDLPCISLASYELDTLRFTQRRHVSFIEKSSPNGARGPAALASSDVPLPSRQGFPEDCLQVLRLLDCNWGCVDCGSGIDGKTPPPMWASLSHGTLLCDKCAFLHITRSEEKQFKQKTVVKHLDTGYWSLPEIFTLLEGGNGNFMQAVQGNRRFRRPMQNALLTGGLAPIKEGEPQPADVAPLAFSGLFEARYACKAASAYSTMLQRRVIAVTGAFECERALPFDVTVQDVNVGDFIQRPDPARVKLRDPPSPDEVKNAARGNRGGRGGGRGGNGGRGGKGGRGRSKGKGKSGKLGSGKMPKRPSNSTQTTATSSKQGSEKASATGKSKTSTATTTSATTASESAAVPPQKQKLERRMSDHPRVPDYKREKKDKMRKQAKKAKKQERKRRQSI